MGRERPSVRRRRRGDAARARSARGPVVDRGFRSGCHGGHRWRRSRDPDLAPGNHLAEVARLPVDESLGERPSSEEPR
jgi:hypothetical protein